AAEVVDEGPSEVTVVLATIGDTKVKVIKAVREITGLGLVDAKKLVDGAPANIKENISPEEAEEIKNKLVEAGATVEIK
ncbi:MAG: 50S ribosomal protein L7/L12, partial [Faecalicoccus sp.]|nr:50S ribosomal protein L7/L12 [Faecalicoccus sp.]